MPMVNTEGNNLFVSVKGNGVPIVFIHPPLLTSVNFEYQIDELSRYFKVITFDIRGHGNSCASSEPLTYPLIVDDIKQILNHLDIKKAFLCGYSLGASIALEFLLTSAERALGGILISGMSEVSDWFLSKRISLAKNLARFGGLPLLTWSITRSNSNTQDQFKRMFSSAIQGNGKNIAQYYLYSLEYNCTNQLRFINLPTILIYGKKDKHFQKYAKLLHEQLPNNNLKLIENVDHRVPTRAANELNQIISQFIQNETDH